MAFDNIDMIPVQSTNVAAIGFDPVARLLLVEFKKSGQRYAYHGVTEEEFNGMLGAPSAGQYLNQVIKPKYGVEKVV